MIILPGIPRSAPKPFPQTSKRHFRSRERLRGVKQAATIELRKSVDRAASVFDRTDAAGDLARYGVAVQALEAFQRLPLGAFVAKIESQVGIDRIPKSKLRSTAARPAVMTAREVMPAPRPTYRQTQRDKERSALAAVRAATNDEDSLAALCAWNALTRLGGNEIGRIVAPSIGAYISGLFAPVEDRARARVAKANATARAGKAAAR